MPLRRLIAVSSMALGIAAAVPTAATATAKRVTRPLKGITTNVTTVNLLTGAATIVRTGHLSHFGRFTGSGNLTFTLTGTNGFSFAGTETLVSARGDELFTAAIGSGTFGPPIETTGVTTITGGTGRFTGASGTMMSPSSPTVVSITSTTEITTATSTVTGQISYIRHRP